MSSMGHVNTELHYNTSRNNNIPLVYYLYCEVYISSGVKKMGPLKKNHVFDYSNASSLLTTYSVVDSDYKSTVRLLTKRLPLLGVYEVPVKRI